jgi:hypothetical protein
MPGFCRVRRTQIRHSVVGRPEVTSWVSGAPWGVGPPGWGSPQDRGGVFRARPRSRTPKLSSDLRSDPCRRTLGNSQVDPRWPGRARGSGAPEPLRSGPQSAGGPPRTTGAVVPRGLRGPTVPFNATSMRSTLLVWSTPGGSRQTGVEQTAAVSGDTAAVSRVWGTGSAPGAAEPASRACGRASTVRRAGRRRSSARPRRGASGRRPRGRRPGRSGR